MVACSFADFALRKLEVFHQPTDRQAIPLGLEGVFRPDNFHTSLKVMAYRLLPEDAQVVESFPESY